MGRAQPIGLAGVTPGEPDVVILDPDEAALIEALRDPATPAIPINRDLADLIEILQSERPRRQ